MKALSLKQPWAELILQGRKKIEIRAWNTKFRGEFLIHASKNPDADAMEKFGFKDLPSGFIVGKAELVDVKKYNGKEGYQKDSKLHLSSSIFGNYGFILKNAARIKPVPYKGKLNFFDVNNEISFRNV